MGVGETPRAERRGRRRRGGSGLQEANITVVTALLLLICYGASRGMAMNGAEADYQALAGFKASVDDPEGALGSWKVGEGGSSPCLSSSSSELENKKGSQWFGVKCWKGRVIGVVLEGLMLAGPAGALSSLRELRLLSLKGNRFNGSLPDTSGWRALRFFYASHNHFGGTIPVSLAESSPRMTRLDLSSNLLHGVIPASLSALAPSLLTLRLENNSLSGNIPPVLNLTHLHDFSVAGNRLSGAIPVTLSVFPPSSFQGNTLDLCGPPLLPCPNITNTAPTAIPPSPTLSPSMSPSLPPFPSLSPPPLLESGASHSHKLIIIATGVAAATLLCLIAIALLSRRISTQRGLPPVSPESLKTRRRPGFSAPAPSSSSTDPQKGGGGRGGGGELTFFVHRGAFQLEDLLRASAEMIGRGSLGTAYRAVLHDDCVVAVKRLKDANVAGRREFEQHMDSVAALSHPNLVCLIAYYYARTEKLLVYDYFPNGSLHSLLHDNRGPGRVPLDWTTRVKIALGAASGLAYIHGESAVHGNVKSSNILLDKNGNALVADFGLAAMMATSGSSSMAGHRAPEQRLLVPGKRLLVTREADVYSFGVLLLETLTGKAPTSRPEFLDEDDNYCYYLDLPRWVESVVREEWTAEVFDVELLKYNNIEEEMVTMLQIGLGCTNPSPEMRPKMTQVLTMIQGIIGGGGYQSTHDSLSHSPSASELDDGSGY